MQTVSESLLLRYAINLERNGYQDGPWTNEGPWKSTAARMDALHKHVHAWDNLDWKFTTITVPNGDVYELANGVYAQGNDRSVTCVELPSRIRGIAESRTWVHEDVGFVPRDLIIDPTQDLLVLLVEYVFSNMVSVRQLMYMH